MELDETLADREIAALMGAKEATVRTLAARAFAMLRDGGLVASQAAPPGGSPTTNTAEGSSG